MITSVNDLDFEVDHRITGKHTAGGSLTDTVFDRFDILFGDVTANDFILDGDTGTTLLRDQVDDTVTILTATAGLTDELGIGPSPSIPVRTLAW